MQCSSGGFANPAASDKGERGRRLCLSWSDDRKKSEEGRKGNEGKKGYSFFPADFMSGILNVVIKAKGFRVKDNMLIHGKIPRINYPL